MEKENIDQESELPSSVVSFFKKNRVKFNNLNKI